MKQQGGSVVFPINFSVFPFTAQCWLECDIAALKYTYWPFKFKWTDKQQICNMNQPFLTTIKHIGLVFTAAILNMIAATVQAQPIQGITFSHHDWELACDNTGTCRAAGYEAFGEEGDLGISVLLTRAAGANQAVSGELYVCDLDDESILPLTIQFQIGDKNHDTIDYQSAPTALSAEQCRLVSMQPEPISHCVFRCNDKHNPGQGMSAFS